MDGSSFDWKSGHVAYASMNFDEGAELADAPDELNEDLLQVEYGERVVLDVGWYPAHHPGGRFRVLVVVGGDWEAPAHSMECRTLAELRLRIGEAIDVAETAARSLTHGS